MKQKATPSREPSAAELREVLPPLDATLEQLARVLMNTPPKKRWRYLEKKKEAHPDG